jgi:hypothetical protein
MSRLNRKNRTDVIFASKGGITDLLDNVLKDTWRVSDEEFDYICEFATDQELDSVLIDSASTFYQKRNAILTVNRLIDKYYNEKN